MWLLGWSGFLPARGSFMLDFVFVAMFAVVPLMLLAIYLARYRRAYRAHKQLQLALGLILLVAVLLFELDLRFFTDWEALAAASPYWVPDAWNPVWYSLVVHLAFAIPTLVLWTGVIVAGLKHFSKPPQPGPHSRTHVFWGRLAALGMIGTAVTGWVFYYLAFMAA